MKRTIAGFLVASCWATAAISSERSVVSIEVPAACPTTLVSPPSRAVCAGTPTAFTAIPSEVLPGGIWSWTKDATGIGGANTATHSIASVAAADAGVYVATLVDSCGSVATNPARLDVGNFAPPHVAGTLTITETGANQKLNWTDVANSTAYSVFEDASAAGPFTTLTGSASSGTTGLTVPVPGADRFYRVAGTNGCGTGPKGICPTITVIPVTIPKGKVGTPYSQNLIRINGAAPITWTIAAGALPPPLSISSGTGTISGTPAAAGLSTFSVLATDANGCAGYRTYVDLRVCAVLGIAPPAAAHFSTAYPQPLVGTGGTAPYTFVLASGSLPAGLSLAPDGGISGSPTDTGSSTFQVTVTDVNGCSDTVSVTLAVKPKANADTYPQSVIGNVNVNSANVTPAAHSATTNDLFPAGATIIAFDATSANGGNVVLETSGGTMGQFTYNPPPGYEGTDTFTYTLSSNGQTDVGTVSVPVSGMVWFVQPGAASCTTLAAGCGRLTNPFSALTALAALNDGIGTNPAAGDNIFVYEGTPAAGPLTLLDGQRLIGQDSTSSLAALTGLTPQSGSAGFPATAPANGPVTTITPGGAGSNAVNLAAGNTVNGLSLAAANDAALARAAGSLGTTTLADLRIDTSGTGSGIVLGNTTGTLGWATGSLTAGGSGNALSVNGGSSSLNVGVPMTVTAGRAVSVASRSGGSVTYGGTITATGGSTGISILAPSAPNTVAFTAAVTLGTGGARLTGGTALTVNHGAQPASTSFSNLTVHTNGQSGIDVSNGGTLTISAGLVDAAGARALLASGVAFPAAFASVTSTGGANGVSLTNVTGTQSLGTGALSGASGSTFLLSGGSGAVSFGGTIGQTTAGQRVVDVQGRTGGTVALAGAITSTGGGLLFSGNASTTLNLTGGINLSTAASPAFTASGGGTMSLTGPTNDISTTTGTGITVSGTAIGPGGFTFRNVTVTGAAPNGILLSGSSGDFTVTGPTAIGQAAGSGPGGTAVSIANHASGAISFSTVDVQRRGNTGILISNFDGTTASFGATTIPNQANAGGYGIRVDTSSAAITFASATISDPFMAVAQVDGDSNGIPDTDGDGDGIFLSGNSGSFRLNGGSVTNPGNDGIDVRNSAALILSSVTIGNPGQDVVGGSFGNGGHGIAAYNLSGTSSLTSCMIEGFNKPSRDGFYLTSDGTNVLDLTVHGTTFRNATGNRGFGIGGFGTSNTTVTVGGATNSVSTNCTFGNISGTAHQISANDSSVASLTVRNSTFQSSPTNGKTNLIGSNTGGGRLALTIRDNTFSNVFLTASTGEGLINVSNDGTLAGNRLDLSITGNTINGVGNDTSACGAGATRCLGPIYAILAFIDDAANVPGTILIDGNTIVNVQQTAVMVDMANTGAASSAVAAKITNNCIGKLKSGTTCTGADAPVGRGAGLTGGSGIRVERRRNNSPSGNVLISGNTIRNGVGQSAGALNTPGIFVRTKANSNLSATITGNNVDTNFVGCPEIRLDTNANDAGDIVAPVQCVDVTGNTLPAGAAAVIDINETNGTHGIEQASSAAVSSGNGSATVTPDAGVAFGVACAAPPTAPAE